MILLCPKLTTKSIGRTLESVSWNCNDQSKGPYSIKKWTKPVKNILNQSRWTGLTEKP